MSNLQSLKHLASGAHHAIAVRSARVRQCAVRAGAALFLGCASMFLPASSILAAEALIGTAAPDFVLRSLGGENVRLSEQLGQVVVLNFWATWCGPCRQEMPLLDELYNKYRRAGLALYSINLDDASDGAAEMARTLQVTYPVLFDQRKEVSKAYQVGTLPITVLIDREGRVRYVSESYKPGYEKRYTEVVRELLNE